MLADALGRPSELPLTAASATMRSPLRPCSRASRPRRVLADKAYDSKPCARLVAEHRRQAVIPSTRLRKPRSPTTDAYRLRNRIERCFNKLKHFRRFATRFDRRAIHFLSFIQLAAAMIWMR